MNDLTHPAKTLPSSFNGHFEELLNYGPPQNPPGLPDRPSRADRMRHRMDAEGRASAMSRLRGVVAACSLLLTSGA